MARTLHLSKNSIVNIEPLSRLPALEKVYLAENRIQDPSPLLKIDTVRLLNIGLDDQESPLEASRWLLSNNPIISSFCQQEDMPYLFEFHCSVHSQDSN